MCSLPQKNTIRHGGSTALYALNTVDMVYTVDMVNTVDTVYAIETTLKKKATKF